MSNFFDNFWNTISVLAWSDWLTLFILVFFVIRGFIQGLAKEIISLLFVILAIALAWLYYDNLANSLIKRPKHFGGPINLRAFVWSNIYRVFGSSRGHFTRQRKLLHKLKIPVSLIVHSPR